MCGGTMRAMALAAAWLLTAGTALAGDAPPERARLQALSGVWESPAPEPWYGGWGTRRFSFRDGHWELVFAHALDQAMQRPTFVFRTHGPYRVGAPSAVVPGAFEAVFFEDRKLVTLMTADPRLVQTFGFAGCGLEEGREVDVSERGCANWKPVSACPEDHDLLAPAGAGLRFGVRPRDNDMCTADRRPTALLPPVMPR